MTKSGHIVAAVEEDSPASRAGIAKGDALLAAAGEAVVDLIDYLALTNPRRVELRVKKPDGRIVDVTLAKREGEPLGVAFDSELMSERRLCANRCVFCFVDQNPPNARETLRVKDDDWRESLMMGNYVTLTNVTDAEFARLLKRRVQPLYLSVHAYDPLLRAQLLGRKRAAGVWERLETLSVNGLAFHAQIVLCPGLNDGVALSQTLTELVKLPNMRSTAVVPVGLTAHREGLARLEPFSVNCARDAIRRVEAIAAGRVFAADELYIMANLPLPAYDAYGDFPQIENGVGMIRLFEDEFLTSVEETTAKPRAVILTGEAAAPFLSGLIGRVPAFGGVRVVPVKSCFFGGHVNVAGLVTGADIARALSGAALDGVRVLLPETMLKDGEVFLDDMTLSSLSDALGVRAEPVPVSGFALWEALVGVR